MARPAGLLLRPGLWYPVLLGLYGLFKMVTWPIVAGDSDLWFHLSDGRYLYEHLAIPGHSFFSFLSPAREWVNYSWLFKGILYPIFVATGYQGLILFRALMWTLTIAVVALYLFQAQRRHHVAAWPVFVVVLYGMILMLRQTQIRPHLMTYLLIPAFLYILEFAPRRAMWLPLFGTLWCNLHGIMYPIMLLICGAYLFEYFVERLRGRRYDETWARQFLMPAFLSFLTVYLTPHGTALLEVPFIPKAYTVSIIREFSAITLGDLSSISVLNLTPSHLTWFNTLLVGAYLGLVASVARRRFRISHLVIFASGVALLTNGIRFTTECALLALPVLAANPPVVSGYARRRMPKPVFLIVMTVAMIMPLTFLAEVFQRRPKYPFSYQNLPHGVVTFLNGLQAGGRVFNHPNMGGYLRWALHPSYQIHMDLEVPHLFTNTDLYLGRQAFHDQKIFQHAVSAYAPDFLTVPVGIVGFRDIVKDYPDYVPVFFDDVEVLYASTARHPDVVAQYALKTLDAFQVVSGGHVYLEPDKRAQVMEELGRLFAVYPSGRYTNYLAGILLNEEGAYDRAVRRGEAIVEEFPEFSLGYRIMGDAWKGLREFDRALAAYRQALHRARGEDSSVIRKNMGLIYLERGQFRKAYRTLRQSVDLYGPGTSVEDLYRLGSSALSSGNLRDGAAILLHALQFRIGANDVQWVNTIKDELGRYNIDADEELPDAPRGPGNG